MGIRTQLMTPVVLQILTEFVIIRHAMFEIPATKLLDLVASTHFMKIAISSISTCVHTALHSLFKSHKNWQNVSTLVFKKILNHQLKMHLIP